MPSGGFGPWQWAWQYPAVRGPFRAVVYPPRGTGQSSEQTPANTISPLVADLRAVINDLAARRLHLVGFGLGGRVALEYTREHSHVRSLTLLQTPAGDPAVGGDLTALTPPEQEPTTTLLSSEFVATHPEVVDQVTDWRQTEDAPAAYWRALRTVLMTPRDWPLYTVTTPTLLLYGGADHVVPRTNADVLANGLPRARDVVFDDAAHLVGVERSRPVNDLLLGFIEEHAATE